jgi:micrococcal nuclease
VLVAWFDRQRIRRVQASRTDSEASRRIQDTSLYHGKTFTVVHVVDGDTLDIDFPDGENRHTRIRLLGIDTPEAAGDDGPQYFSREATQAASDLAAGQVVRIYLDKGGRSRGYYGRLLAYVKLPDGTFLNEALLCEGFAYADLRFRHGLYNRYRQLEAGARTVAKGLWAEVSREQLPQWLQREKPTFLAN